MILDRQNAETCDHLLQASNLGASILDRFQSVTLSGAIETFVIAARSPNGNRLRREIRTAAGDGSGLWRELLLAWEKPKTSLDQPFAAHSIEFRRLNLPQTEADLLDDSLFEQRFRRSLVGNGFTTEAANMFALAFHEMIDNTYQHSRTEQTPAPSVAAYHVSMGYFAFSVADLGGGFLASLSSSPQWKNLASDQEAVLAVIHQSASRRFEQGEGQGFKLLFKALADRGASLRIRSQSTIAQVEATAEGRRAVIHKGGPTSGSHISVCCRLQAPPNELPYKSP